jgi:hypothetical protein
VILINIVKKLLKKEPIKELLLQFNPFKAFSLKDDDKLKEYHKVYKVLKGTILIGLLYGIILYSPLASEKIGGIFEKSEYTTNYYINLFPENSETKNYLVKAQIHVFTEEYDENTSERVYRLQEAYFPNGGKITFYDYGDSESLSLNEKVYLKDDSGRYWDIVLTPQKCKD